MLPLPHGSARGIQVVLQRLAHVVFVAIQQHDKLHGKSKNHKATNQMTRQKLVAFTTAQVTHLQYVKMFL